MAKDLLNVDIELVRKVQNSQCNDSLLEQIVGRVQRQYEDKIQPLVVDINFAGYADKKQNNDRLALYLRKGWQIITA